MSDVGGKLLVFVREDVVVLEYFFGKSCFS